MTHEARELDFTTSIEYDNGNRIRFVEVEVEGFESKIPSGRLGKIPSGLGSYTEAHVYDWSHPDGNPTVLIIGVERKFEHAGYTVWVKDGDEWLSHESGSVSNHNFREFCDDGDFDVDMFEEHMAVALA